MFFSFAGELLYIQSQIPENSEIVEPESYIKSSDLFDNDIFAEELSDIICIALAELPTTLTIVSIVETLLHIHNGPEIVCRLVANFPDSFREGILVFNMLIISIRIFPKLFIGYFTSNIFVFKRDRIPDKKQEEFYLFHLLVKT